MNRPLSDTKHNEPEAMPALTALLLPFKTLKAFQKGFSLQTETVQTFYAIAGDISGPECPSDAIPNGMLELKRNVFSTLFLAITRSIASSDTYMPLYAMVNQCMRAWVTACDNILDDEYKTIFDFHIEGRGDRMRSVLTLMLAERVLTTFVTDNYQDPELLKIVEKTSLQALISSALQECEEEGGDVGILTPDQVIREIHQRKTADLFVAPLILPFQLENPKPEIITATTSALENFALACQLIDDVKDMCPDARTGRHNLLLSLLAEEKGEAAAEDLRTDVCTEWNAWDRYPTIVANVLQRSQEYFQESFRSMSVLGIRTSAKQQKTVFQLICTLLRIPFST